MGKVSKCGLLTVNFFVVGLGVCVIGMSAAILRQNTLFGVVLSDLFYTVPLTSMLVGVFLTTLGIMGCMGTIKENQTLLMIYAAIVSVLLVVVLMAGIMMITFSSHASFFITRSMTTVFNEYGDDEEYIDDGLDLLQHKLHCCGINAYTDWANFTYGNGTNVGDGCCRNQTVGCGEGLLVDPGVEELVFTEGCLTPVTRAFDTICTVLGITTFVLVCIQALSVAWACIIARDSKRYERMRE